MGMAGTILERLAIGIGYRQAPDCHRLASQRIPTVLEVEESPSGRATPRVAGSHRSDSSDELGESWLGRTTDSRRTVEAGIRTVARHGWQVPGPAPEAAVAELAHVSDKPHAELGLCRFFLVPTITFRLLFVFVILSHDRRRPIHIAVTANPTAEWTTRQLLEAFPWDSAPRYLLRDRDACYGEEFHKATGWLGIREVLTAPRSPWQNPYVERLIGTIRRECLDHVIVMNEPGLRRVLKLYFEYYERTRTHLSLDKDAPIPRSVQPPELGKVVELPQVGGLHHRYERRAA